MATPFSAYGEPDIRLEDYIDDKLQSTTDLDEIDTLLASVEEQRSQLQTQLDTAAHDLEEARRTAVWRGTELASQMSRFQQLQHNIDARLPAVSSATAAPDAAIRRLEEPLRQLRRVDVARAYLELLRDVEALRSQARAHLPRNPRAALEPYGRLRELAGRLRELQGAADEAAAHLVAHVGGIADGLWDEMKRTMWDEFEGLLARRQWPGADPEKLEVDDEWRDGFEKLLDLQAPEVLQLCSRAASEKGAAGASAAAVPLLPVDVMAQMFVKEFRYHFMNGDKKTSEARQVGEVCFPWVVDRVERWQDFLRDNFGPVLASRFGGTAAAGKTVYVDPACALITSLLPVVREKVEAAAAEAVAVADAAFLSQLVSQVIRLDDELRSGFGYDGGDADKGWDGLAADLLREHFARWLQAEKDFALDRFRAIMASADARDVDYEHSGPGKTKPTHGAVRVTDLLRSVTDQYRGVRKFSHKLRFLIDIQLAILDEYHDRLRGSLEAYYSMTSTVGRTLHGATKEQLAALEGTGALSALCRVYGSADYVVRALRDWSNDEFFVLLWDELQARAQRADDPGGNAAEGMSYDQVRDRTSAAVGTDDDGGALFDETVAAYAMRRKTALEFLAAATVEAQQKSLRAYLQRAQWTDMGGGDDDRDEAGGGDGDGDGDGDGLAGGGVTAELDEALRVVQRNLDFLARALGTAAFRRVLRAAADRLQEALWAEVLLRHSFTAGGAAQLARDVAAAARLVDRYVPDGGGAGLLSTVVAGVRLLNLPREPADGVPSLRRASDRVFTDNAEAKQVLGELGLDEALTPAQARQILQRRVENND